jgi:hypothetical protein
LSIGEGMALGANTRRLAAVDYRRFRLSRARACDAANPSAALARIGVVVVLLVMAAVFAGVARAEGVAPQDVATTTGDTSSSLSGDPATDTTGTQPSTDPSGSPTDPSTTPSETPADGQTATEPPADNTGTDPTSPPPGDTAQEPQPPGSGDVVGGSDGETPVVTEPPPLTEPPPVTDPVPPVPPATDDPPVVVIDDGTAQQPPATPSFGGGDDTGLLLDVQTAAPLGLDTLKIGGSASTKGRDARLSDNDARSTKEQSAGRSLPSGGSPASSPSSAASGASGASSGGGGGVALAVEFLLAALLVLHYTRKASFTLPDSLAFALREERPG